MYVWDLKEELQRTNLELDSYKEKIKENQEKIKLNKQLPYLVGNIVEVTFQFPWSEVVYKFGLSCIIIFFKESVWDYYEMMNECQLFLCVVMH